MGATAGTGNDRRWPRRRWLIMAAVIVLALLVVVGLVAAWLYFFGSEAPPAPTLEDALRVLASPTPAP